MHIQIYILFFKNSALAQSLGCSIPKRGLYGTKLKSYVNGSKLQTGH